MDGDDQVVLHGVLTEAKVIAPDVDSGTLARDSHIADVGINSMQTLELVGRLEDRFGVELPDYELAGVQTVGDLVDLIAKSRLEV